MDTLKTRKRRGFASQDFTTVPKSAQTETAPAASDTLVRAARASDWGKRAGSVKLETTVTAAIQAFGFTH